MASKLAEMPGFPIKHIKKQGGKFPPCFVYAFFLHTIYKPIKLETMVITSKAEAT